MRIPIFGSCPTIINKRQFEAKRIIFRQLDKLGLEWRSLGQTDYPNKYPLYLNPGSDFDTIRPKSTAFFGGMYLPGDDDCYFNYDFPKE